MAHAAAQTKKLYPGQRLLADGSVYTFNMDLVRDAEAAEEVEANQHADLTRLSDEELSGLLYSCLRLHFAPVPPMVKALGQRIGEERTRRGIDSGGARIDASHKAAA